MFQYTSMKTPIFLLPSGGIAKFHVDVFPDTSVRAFDLVRTRGFLQVEFKFVLELLSCAVRDSSSIRGFTSSLSAVKSMCQPAGCLAARHVNHPLEGPFLMGSDGPML